MGLRELVKKLFRRQRVVYRAVKPQEGGPRSTLSQAYQNLQFAQERYQESMASWRDVTFVDERGRLLK